MGLRVLSLEVKVDTLPFSTLLSIFHENYHWENFSSHCINKVEQHTTERKKKFRTHLWKVQLVFSSSAVQ
jgi:hypothetical protein